MKDPDSARFGSMVAGETSEGVIQVCGYVNGKNSYGGYTGEQPFIGVLGGVSQGQGFATAVTGEESATVCRLYGLPI